ncbi:TetR/AcrR family transcriptional regulator [Dactylosporangium sp. NPDC049525]|uniref:TetR/AcrR family transcriptional regulator n=1 Tax=Dactylosporangium sp. NPDC049525 TaxID=3154730 RepID=UPI003447EB99
MTTPPTRRERVRAATVEEIKQTARALLVKDGVAGLSLRAIAREMGMVPAALYRYFPSMEALMEAVTGDLYDDTRNHLERARDAAPSDDPGARLDAVCRALRRWALEHPAEFGIIFGTPLPLTGDAHLDPTHVDSPAHQAGDRFATVFSTLFAEIWMRAPFPAPAPDEVPPALRAQLQAYVDRMPVPVPVGAAQVALSCWIRLYGMIALEAYGHLHFALTDPEPMFELELASGLRRLGVVAS